MPHISPFALLVDSAPIRAAARRAEFLELPRHRSPKFVKEIPTGPALAKSPEELELDAILDEIESSGEDDLCLKLLLDRLSGDGDQEECAKDDAALQATLPTVEDEPTEETCHGGLISDSDTGPSLPLRSNSAQLPLMCR